MVDFDVVTFGETMLRLSPPDHQQIEQASQFSFFSGGTESNVAVGLARLVARVAWFSRLPDNPLGHVVINSIRQHRVDTSYSILADDGRMGLYFAEEHLPPRSINVIYDRADSSMSRMQPDEIPESLFTERRTRWLHMTGITLALSESARAAAGRALELAVTTGTSISFDVNYRSKLWDPQTARDAMLPFLEVAQIIFIPQRDAQVLFDLPEDQQAQDVLHWLHERYPSAVIAMTRGADGSSACDVTGQIMYQPAFNTTPVSRIGTGDAFDAGFLYAHLMEWDVSQSLAWGNAAAALKYSIAGDMPVINRHDIEQILGSTHGYNIQR